MLPIEEYRAAVNEALAALPCLLGAEPPFDEAQILDASQEGKPPQPLRAAMRYSLLLGGKRIRPVLLLMAYHLLKEDWREALPFACAIEMIHTYSLIHDDLPALDNDSMRRGKPSNHMVFGESMAILAGDGLLNLAYETMLSAPLTARQPQAALQAIAEIATRAGVTGMIAGQTLDVTLEGATPSEKAVRYIHQHKTADLLTAPIVAGLHLAGANAQQLAAGESYGQNLGLCFQIVDDLLDVQGDAVQMGKTLHKDEACGKQTWPVLFGIEESQKQAQCLSDQACDAIRLFGEKADGLVELCRRLVYRNQ